jgi:hypothetical protein
MRAYYKMFIFVIHPTHHGVLNYIVVMRQSSTIYTHLLTQHCLLNMMLLMAASRIQWWDMLYIPIALGVVLS